MEKTNTNIASLKSSMTKTPDGVVTVTIAPLTTEHKGETTSPDVSKSFLVEKIGGKKEKEETGKKSDGTRKDDAKDTAKLKNKEVQSSGLKQKVSHSAPGDWPEPDELDAALSGDAMTDFSLGKKFIKSKDDPKPKPKFIKEK